MKMVDSTSKRGAKPPKTATSSTNHNVALYVTYINIILYALCFQLQRPIEPYLVQQLSKNATSVDEITRTYGRLQSFFSIIQTIGSPIAGILLDRVGIRITSCIVFTASALSYGILALATSSLRMLFYSKIPTAFQHAFLVAQAVAATTCANNDAARAKALGRMTTAYTIGATIGPMLGGYLAEMGGMYFAAKLAVAGSLLSVVLSILYLPGRDDSNNKKVNTSSNKLQDQEQVQKRNLLQEIQFTLSIALRSSLWPLLVVKVIGGIVASMHQTALPIVLSQDLRMEPSELGLIMSSSMFATAVFGAVGIGPTMNLFKTTGMTYIGLFIRSLVGCLMAYAVTSYNTFTMLNPDYAVIPGSFVWIPIRNQIIVLSILHTLASHSLATGLTTQTTGAVATNEQGTLLGLEHGLFSMARIVGPTVGTSILLSHNFLMVNVVCGVIDVALVGLLVLAKSSSASPAAKVTEDISNCNVGRFKTEQQQILKNHSFDPINHDEKSK